VDSALAQRNTLHMVAVHRNGSLHRFSTSASGASELLQWVYCVEKLP
jgi:hypothetical protein